MFLKVVALFLCITYAACDDTVRSFDCANQTMHSRDVRMEVSGCTSEDERCKLIQGTNHTVKFFFTPTDDFLQKTDFRVYGVFPKFTVPYGKRSDACLTAMTVDDETSCTSLTGFHNSRSYKHISSFSVSSNYPKIQLNVRFQMVDRRTKKLMICREVPVEIIGQDDAENEA